MNLVPLNLKDPKQMGFAFDLAVSCREAFVNDHENDIILSLCHYERRLAEGSATGFLAVGEGVNTPATPAGIFWIETDCFGVGRVRGALMPQYRGWSYAMGFYRRLIAYGFDVFGLRKLDAELLSDFSRQSRAAELTLIRLGFEREGALKEALLMEGKPVNTLLLGLTQTRYRQLAKPSCAA